LDATRHPKYSFAFAETKRLSDANKHLLEALGTALFITSRRNPSRSVFIVIVPSVSSVLSVPLFREVKKYYPNIVLNIDEATTLDIRRSLHTGPLIYSYTSL
jgi:hypothetical protein